MRGYLITPLLFVVLFLIAASFGFYMHQSDEHSSLAITREGEIKKAISSTEKDMSSMISTAYETMYSNPEVNEKSEMERLIADEISNKHGETVSVQLSKKGKDTEVKLTFPNYKKRYGNVNITGTTYTRTVGHPFYSFYEIHKSYDPQEICNYYVETANSCSIDWEAYKNAKEASTGFDFWGEYVSHDNCYSRVFKFKMRITELGNIATYRLDNDDYSFKLKTASGSEIFTADC